MKTIITLCIFLCVSLMSATSRDLESGKYDLSLKVKGEETKFSGFLLVTDQALVFTTVGIEGAPLIIPGTISESGKVTCWHHRPPDVGEEEPHTYHFHGELKADSVTGEGMVMVLLTSQKFTWSLVPSRAENQ